MTRDEEISLLKDHCAGYRNGQQQLQGILSDVVDSNAKWAEEVAGLRKKIEDLKCCGNCTHIVYDEQTGELLCENDHYPFRITGKCDNWTYGWLPRPVERRLYELETIIDGESLT